MYTTRNFQSKKELVAAVKAGDIVTVFRPGPFGGRAIPDGTAYIEGPHYPQPHRWYAAATVAAGRVVKIK